MHRLQLRVPIALSVLVCVMFASTPTAVGQVDTTGTLIDVGTFTVRIPDVDDWNVKVDKEKGIVEFTRTKQALLSVFVRAGGSTSMQVFKNRPSGPTPGIWLMNEQEMATHFRRAELLGVLATAPRNAQIDSISMDSTVVEGKTCYRLTYAVGVKGAGVKGILHCYFPPEFSRTKEFFAFLVTDLSVSSWWTVEDIDRFKPLVRSLKTAGSTSTLPGVGGDLLRAAASGDSSLVRHLVEGGANVNSLPSDGRGPLALAALYGHESVVRYLVDRGADINPVASPEIYTPLSSAILGREKRIGGFLLEKGARANVLADSQWTPLIRAITMHLDTAFTGDLLAHGADPNLRGNWSPLMHAASEGLAPVVTQLIDHGAILDLQDPNGWTALFIALDQNHPEIAGILLARGANPNATSLARDTPLIVAAHGGDTASVARLIQLGARVNVANKWGYSPLGLAADNGETACVQLLLSNGATIDQRTEDGRTPLYLAVQSHHIDCVRFLLDKGADINARTTLEWTPLMAAAKRGDSVAVQLLISRGAKLDLENNKGDTALDIADDGDFKNIVEMLEKAASRK